MDAVIQPFMDVDLEHPADTTNTMSGCIPVRQRPTFGRLTSHELFSQDFKIDYLIDGVLAEHQHGVISGMFKTQKTHITVAAAVSIATGAKFLNQFDVSKKRRVGVFCGEGGPGLLQRTALAICQYMQIDSASLNNQLLWFTGVPRIIDVAHRVALENAIRADELEVIFLDPTYLLLSGVSDQASNYMIMADALSMLTEIAEKMGVTCIVVHHNKKSHGYSVPDLADISFSGTAEWAGQWILLGHRKAFDPVERVSRLWMNVGGRMGHGGLFGVDICELSNGQPVWQATVRTEGELHEAESREKSVGRTERQNQEVSEMIERIKRVYLKSDKPEMTRRAVADAVGAKESAKVFSQAVDQMVDGGELTEITVRGGNNRDAQGYVRKF
jgi:hypothetical protein